MYFIREFVWTGLNDDENENLKKKKNVFIAVLMEKTRIPVYSMVTSEIINLPTRAFIESNKIVGETMTGGGGVVEQLSSCTAHLPQLGHND